jgi:uncharacterized protein YlxW (UPF0749 family)
MASPSKTKSRTQPANALRDHLDSLQSLVNQVNDEIKALQPLVESAANTAEAEPTTKPASKSVPKLKASTPAKKPKVAAAKKPAAKPATLLEAVNTMPLSELIEKLKNAGAKQHVVRNIVNQRKRPTFQKFASHDDLIKRIKGLAESSLDNLLSEWS